MSSLDAESWRKHFESDGWEFWYGSVFGWRQSLQLDHNILGSAAWKTFLALSKAIKTLKFAVILGLAKQTWLNFRTNFFLLFSISVACIRLHNVDVHASVGQSFLIFLSEKFNSFFETVWPALESIFHLTSIGLYLALWSVLKWSQFPQLNRNILWSQCSEKFEILVTLFIIWFGSDNFNFLALSSIIEKFYRIAFLESLKSFRQEIN